MKKKKRKDKAKLPGESPWVSSDHPTADLTDRPDPILGHGVNVPEVIRGSDPAALAALIDIARPKQGLRPIE